MIKSIKTLVIIVSLLLISCNAPSDTYTYKESIRTTYFITSVNKAKYSKVIGYIFYGNLKMSVTNGNTGYYYKDYNLKSGDKIEIDVTIYQSPYVTTNPYKDDVHLCTSDADLTKYEIKR